jgi:hypothetical protein
METMEGELGDEFLNTFYINFMLLRPNVCCSLQYSGTFSVQECDLFFRLGVKRPAAQPEEFRGRGRGFTPVRYICDIYL